MGVLRRYFSRKDDIEGGSCDSSTASVRTRQSRPFAREGSLSVIVHETMCSLMLETSPRDAVRVQETCGAPYLRSKHVIESMAVNRRHFGAIASKLEISSGSNTVFLKISSVSSDWDGDRTGSRNKV